MLERLVFIANGNEVLDRIGTLLGIAACILDRPLEAEEGVWGRPFYNFEICQT